VRVEGRPCGVEHLRRPTQIPRSERDFGLSYYAPRARHGFFRTEGPRSAPQQFLRSRVFPELRHRDASKRERWRIVSQGDSLQRS
jgi:hypothetical protein